MKTLWVFIKALISLCGDLLLCILITAILLALGFHFYRALMWIVIALAATAVALAVFYTMDNIENSSQRKRESKRQQSKTKPPKE
jgi:mannose/fructose/N-acetylgalactosamine-specific phosphotransferase system component IIC